MEKYAHIQDLKIEMLDTSISNHKYLISYKQRHFEANEMLVKLIEVLKEDFSFSLAAAEFNKQTGKSYTPEEIEQLYEKCIKPILREDTEIKNPFIFKMELLSGFQIDKITRFFQPLFSKKGMIAIILIAVVMNIIFFSTQYIHSLYMADLGLYNLLAVIGLFILSAFFHEIGHLSACRYFNYEHGGIGFGLYINIPVLYADVSNVWKLSRKKRLIVNIAGVYFQFLMLIPCLLLYFYTQSSVLKYFILFTNINFLFTLNPFFKFDGYWIASDLLGVPNLRTRTREVITYYIKKIRNNGTHKVHFVETMKPLTKWTLIVYSTIMNLFLAAFMLVFLPFFMYNFFREFPDTTRLIVDTFSGGEIPFNLLQYFLPKLILAVLLIYFLVTYLRRFYKIIKIQRKSKPITDFIPSE